MRQRTRSSSTSSVIRLLAVWLALAVAASVTALVFTASPAEAIAPACYTEVQRTSISAEGGPNCYYVVINTSNWKKVCEDFDRSFSCTNLRPGNYQVQSYTTSPWKRVSIGTQTIKAPPSGGCTNLVAISGDIGGGHQDGSCYYVVHNTSTWDRTCEGYVFTQGCAGRFSDLAPGRYKVDVYSTGPSWSKSHSHYLKVG